MPSIPSEQAAECAVLPPRGPHDHDTTRPHGSTKRAPAAQHRSPPVEATGPHQRQGDRGDDDDGKRTLPIYVRFHDLTAAGIVGSWTQLLRMVAGEDFPPGVMLSANVRAWRIDEVEHWLATRPTARKVPPPVKKPRRRKQQEAEATA
jgi:hypothetical protein